MQRLPSAVVIPARIDANRETAEELLPAGSALDKYPFPEAAWSFVVLGA